MSKQVYIECCLLNEDALRRSVRGSLIALEQVAKRSTDKSSRAIAEGAAGDLRSAIPADWFEGLS